MICRSLWCKNWNSARFLCIKYSSNITSSFVWWVVKEQLSTYLKLEFWAPRLSRKTVFLLFLIIFFTFYVMSSVQSTKYHASNMPENWQKWQKAIVISMILAKSKTQVSCTQSITNNISIHTAENKIYLQSYQPSHSFFLHFFYYFQFIYQ